MATTTSNPWRGTHQVGIGASLGKALKAKKNGTEAGTSSPAPSTGPGKGRRNLPDREFYSLRYQHKPSSIDPRKPGRIQFTTKEGSTAPSIVIEQASTQPKESVMFSGQEFSLNKLDCVLIYDEDTGTFTLEKLDGGLKLSLDRSLQSIMPHDSSPSSSTPSPDPAPGHSRTGSQLSSSRRKPPSDRDTLNDIDDEIAAVALDTKPMPRSAPPKPSRHQKEEEEEEEEELPLIQQQKIQQDQRRREREREQLEQEARERAEAVRKQEEERAEAVRKQEEERAEANRREQERIREQKEELRRLKQKHDQEKKEKEEEEKRRREKELQDQKEREQLAREQEQRRLEQQQQEQQQRRFISTNKPKVKGPPKKKPPVNPFMPKPPPASSSSSSLPASSSSRSLPKRPAQDNPDVEEFGSIVPPRPTKAPKTKPSQTAATSPKRPSSSGGLVLPGSSNSLSALAPEPALPSSNSIQRYGPSSQKAKAAPAPIVPPPAPQQIEESDDDSDWDEVQVPTNERLPSRVATPVAASADVDDMVDEIFGDFLEEEDPNVEDHGTLDLDNELERGFEEAGLGPSMSDSDDDMEPVSAGLPMDQDGPPMSLNQMLGGLPAPDTDYSSSSSDDSDY